MQRERHDLVIVGAGPAGLSAAGHAQDQGLDCVLLERADHLADTVHCYQKRKHVMAEPSAVPLRSPLAFAPGSREEVLGVWEEYVRSRALPVRYGCEMVSITPGDDGGGGGGFVVRTTAGEEYAAPRVILAIGTQGNPRRLGVPGEELEHVSARLVDPDEHRDRRVVVVGAGDSAIEVALALSDHNRVALIVRKPEIVRAKEALERELLARAARGELEIHYSTTIDRIEPERVWLATPAGRAELAADLVITKLGAEAPRRLLEGLGVEFTAPGREAGPRLSASYESSVPGLYLIGAVTGRDLIKLGINQGYEVVEAILGREVEPADEAILAGRLPWWPGRVSERIATVRERVPLLAGASPEQLREMFLAVEPHEPAPGEPVIRQNDYTNSVYLIAGGRLAVSARPEGAADERPIAELAAGDFFGEMGLISGRRRNATVTAMPVVTEGGAGPARLLEVPRKAMLKLLATAPEVAATIDRVFMIRAFQGYLFPGVPAELLWTAVESAEQIELDRDQVVFTEGDEGDAFYLIRSGQVKVSKQSEGREMVLSYLVAGNFFGETALLSGAPRTATVTTIFPTELIRLARRDFEGFLERHPELTRLVEAKLEERRQASLVAELTPGAGEVLAELIRGEVVMGTDTLLIDNHKCVRCGNCIAACEGVHDDGQARLSLTGIQFYNLLAPNSCWQCEDPLCMLDCPPDAIARDPSGEVYIKSNCIGCGNCEANCPYGNIFMVHPKKKARPFAWVGALLRGDHAGMTEEIDSTVAVKCDLCRDLGNDPACVRCCPTGAAIRLGPEAYRHIRDELVVRRGEV